jgi:hypothetical protein
MDIADNGSFMYDDIESLNNLCEEWSNYSGEYDPDYEPELLLNFTVNRLNWNYQTDCFSVLKDGSQ